LSDLAGQQENHELFVLSSFQTMLMQCLQPA